MAVARKKKRKVGSGAPGRAKSKAHRAAIAAGLKKHHAAKRKGKKTTGKKTTGKKTTAAQRRAKLEKKWAAAARRGRPTKGGPRKTKRRAK